MRLRIYCRHDRGQFGLLAGGAEKNAVEVYRHVLQREDAVPGLIAGIQNL